MNDPVRLSVFEIDILNMCSSVEHALAELYRLMAEVFAHNADISKLLLHIALEEDGHASQFELASRLHGAGMKHVKTSEAIAGSIFSKITLVYKTYKSSPPTLEQALAMLIKIESALREYHVSSIVEFEDESLLRLFATMRGDDEAHIEMLRQALKDVSS